GGLTARSAKALVSHHLPEKAFVDSRATGGDPRPVGRGGGAPGVAGVADGGEEHLVHQLILVGGLVAGRPEEGPHHHPGAGGRVVLGGVAGGHGGGEVG